MSPTTHSSHIPHLRFPGFFGEWEEKKIGNLGKIVGGGTPDTSKEDFWGGNIERFTPTEINSDIVSNSIRKITQEGLKNSSARLLPKGTLLFTSRATIGAVSITQKEVSTNQGFQSIIVNDKNNNYFLMNWIKKNKKEFIRKANGSTFLEISKNEVENLKIIVPPLPEQTKIASFLSAVDEKITHLTDLKSSRESYKSGIMQQIFSQEIRFLDDSGQTFPDWKERKLGEVLYEHKLKSTGQEEVNSVSVHKGIINQIEHLGRSFAAKDTDNYNRVLPHDIVYTKSPTGDFPLGIIKQSHLSKDVIVSPLYGVFTPETKHLGYILHVYFESNINTSNYLASIIQKGAKNTINITNTTFLSNKLKLPTNHDEQEKIADFLSQIDTKIDEFESQIEQAKKWKKGLLQELFI